MAVVPCWEEVDVGKLSLAIEAAPVGLTGCADTHSTRFSQVVLPGVEYSIGWHPAAAADDDGFCIGDGATADVPARWSINATLLQPEFTASWYGFRHGGCKGMSGT